jgi:hypothetical protein
MRHDVTRYTSVLALLVFALLLGSDGPIWP